MYGVPAIAVGIDRGATARILARDAGPSTLSLAVEGGEALRVSEDGEEPLARAFSALIASVRSRRALGPIAAMAEADLPAGAGLGCSAALGVALARALGAETSDEARHHAMAWERVFHGNPSGVDAAVAALGGAIMFARREDAMNEGSVESVSLRAPLVLAIGHSGMASSTRTMVESVARQRARQPEIVEKTFEGIAAIGRSARLAIEAGDVRALGKLLDMNQMLLAGLLLSTQEIEAMCASARAAGALGAKLTGAGGGGCVIALAESRADADRVIAAWKGDGWGGFVTEVAASSHGLRARGVAVEAP